MASYTIILLKKFAARPRGEVYQPVSHEKYEHRHQLPLVAYFCVHSLAVKSCFFGSFNNSWAISGTSGSFGLGSVSNDEIDSSTFEIVSAGLHWSLRMSRQMAPLLFTLQ
eukprot:scaffold116107_cov85-Phaeocystis_antarctica.AAC.1